MPVPTPLHPRTAPLCRSFRWKDWNGFASACAYASYFEQEYYAIRHAAGLVDVTPLNKYDVRGPDAAAWLASVMVRDVRRLRPAQVWYTCWCDDAGRVVDDGTVWRLADNHYRVTSSEPALAWLLRFTRGFDVSVTDVTRERAALSLQGPRARDVLVAATDAPDGDPVAPADLRFFHLTRTRIGGAPVTVTRTGYTGDLGYELWCLNDDALAVYDALMQAGHAHGLLPVGLDAQDICRIEAALVLAGVDYLTAPHCLIPRHTSSPAELDFDWMLDLDRPPFAGQTALRAEHQRGPARRLVGLVYDWPHLEQLYARHGLPPQVCPQAWRDPRPVWTAVGEQVGYATSGTWSPLLKQNIALASVRPEYARPGTELRIELTVDYYRERCRCQVVERPFLKLPRARARAIAPPAPVP